MYTMAEDEDPYPLLRRAEKKEASARGSWKFLSNREQNFEEAAQAYQGAGAAFRKKVLHKEAAGAYEKVQSSRSLHSGSKTSD